MKALFLVLVSAFISVAEGEILPAFGQPKLIGGNEQVKVFASARVDQKFQVPMEFYRINAILPDNREIILDSGRVPWGASSRRAAVNPEGHIALAQGSLQIFFAPDYKPTVVQKLRTDRLPYPRPAIGHFSICDVTWEGNTIACAGFFHLKDEKNSRPHERFHFISRLKVTTDPGIKDHQILWTSWKPQANAEPPQDDLVYQGDEEVSGSLHIQGNQVLWRNVGNWRQLSFPADASTGFAKGSWQLTSLETGKTEALADQTLDREKLGTIEADLVKQLEANPLEGIPQRTKFLLEALRGSKP